ncbi:magnesium transporter NIPA-domain-containing protein [Phlebopus sp. FC_14]|nr:magnesium transporter NIPA-domain-containing protein [Phlebopus sp. FC_14]
MLEQTHVPSSMYMAFSRATATDDPGVDLPHLTLQTIIGISVAIAGNVLISLALNIQKLVHLRLELERENVIRERQSRRPERLTASSCLSHATNASPYPTGSHQPAQESLLLETRPLMPHRSHSSPPTSYGVAKNDIIAVSDDTRSRKSSYTTRSRRRQRKKGFASRFLPLTPGSTSRDSTKLASDNAVIPVDDIPSDERNRSGRVKRADDWVEGEGESNYLHSKLWWFGFILMNVGETGNFISYAFAPASIVAPLGTFALVANCFLAPLILKEHFRPRDLFGIFLAVIGATTVVLSSPSPDGAPPPLTQDALIDAITQRSFIIFSIVYLALAVILAGLSESRAGKRLVVVDVGLCAIFGGFTVLATKAISTLLTKEWARMFAEWITYPVLAVLVVTGILQIRYLNRALRRFDSKMVIPTQFVLFTLSAVIGSAVLYGDFRRATFHQMVTFSYGCGATFAGVFVIAWVSNGSAEVRQIDEEGCEAPGRQDDASRVDRNVVVASANGRPMLVLPKAAHETPMLRKKRSALSQVGYSPGQHLLLVHTPPRDRAEYWDGETEGEVSRRA